MNPTRTMLSGVMLALALTLVVSACARRSDKPVTMTPRAQADVRESRSPIQRGTEDAATVSAVEDRLTRERIARPGAVRVDSDRGTVYLKGSVATPQDKQRAGEVAAGVPGVATVVNQLGVGTETMVDPARTSRAGGDAGQCSMTMRNPAMRTEAIFGPIQIRVFDDIASPLNRTTARPYDRNEGRSLTAAEIDALERQKGRSLTDSEIRSLEMERTHAARGTDVLPSTERSSRTLTQAEIRELEAQKGRPLTESEIHDLEQQGARTETNDPRLFRGKNTRGLADAQAGETGGRQQETGSAQQAGTGQEIGQSRPTSSEHALVLGERDRLSGEQRARLYGDEARIADRRGNLIWSGWLKPNETVAIPNANGPIRYDYRFMVDDRFHDERGAWCNNNIITVP